MVEFQRRRTDSDDFFAQERERQRRILNELSNRAAPASPWDRIDWTEAPFAMARFDASGELITATQAWYDLTGQDADHSRGRQWFSMVTGEERKRLEEALFRASLEGSEIHDQVTLRKNSPDERIVEVHGMAIKLARRKDDNPEIAESLGHLVVLFDITERLRSERELAQARDAAMAAAETRSRILATMSHEVRTPMNGIMGIVEVLMLEGGLDQSVKAQLELLQGNAEALMAMLNDVLDYSRMEAGVVRLDKKEFIPTKLVSSAAESLRPMAESKGLDLHIGIDPALDEEHIGDSLRIRQIIQNLVSNAIKFTDTGEIQVQARLLSDPQPETPRLIQISVSDTGSGLHPSELKVLFEPFQRLHHDAPGTGLGLAISRHLAQAMGGTLEYQDTPGKGATFVLAVPLVPTNGQGANLDIFPVASAANHYHILIVDDNEVNRRVLSRQLELIGVKSTAVPSGMAALEQVGRHPYDVVLLDCRMPHMDGFETSRRIRMMERAGKSARKERIPIVAVTANSFAEDRQQAIANGMDDYLAKPVSVRDLTRALSKALDLDEHELGQSVERSDDPCDHVMNEQVWAQFQEDMGSELGAEIIEMFLNALQGRLADISQSIASADTASLRSTAHALKSPAIQLGSSQLAHLCAQMENKARNGTVATMQDYREMEEAAQCLADELRKRAQSMSS